MTRNILLSVIIKFFSIIINLLLVPLFITYLNEYTYGVWITLSSIILWFDFFDIGLGKGLQNKLSEALSINDFHLAKEYVSTAYILIISVSCILYIIGIIIIPHLDWSVLLNTSENSSHSLKITIFIVYTFFWPRFILKTISIILYADQRPALSNALAPISSLIILIATYLLNIFDDTASLTKLALVTSLAPTLIYLFFHFYLFKGKYKRISPNFNYISIKHVRRLLSLGLNFFLLQISVLVLFQTTAILIAQLFDPLKVTQYNIAYRFFSLLYMLFTIVITPYWAVYTEAWIKNDLNWIKKSIKNLLIFWFLLIFLGVFMLVSSSYIYEIWIGNEIHIPFKYSFYLFIYFIIITFGGIFNMFINGISKLRLQIIFTGIGAIFFIPISILLIKVFNMNVEGIILAMIIANIYHPIIAPIQYYKIINGKAHGIWNK